MFSQKVLEELGYYVYCLVDPRDKKIFYIGKGVGNRVFAHACDALEYEGVNTDKLEKIREIVKSGREVEHYIIRHKLSEEDALTVESVLIDFLTYQDFNTESLLTNIVAGHHQWDEGIKTADEIKLLYDCKPLELKPGHKLLMYNPGKNIASVQLETFSGDPVKSELDIRISRTSEDHIIRTAEIEQSKRNKNKWVWAIRKNIDKNSPEIMKWYADVMIDIYRAIEG